MSVNAAYMVAELAEPWRHLEEPAYMRKRVNVARWRMQIARKTKQESSHAANSQERNLRNAMGRPLLQGKLLYEE